MLLCDDNLDVLETLPPDRTKYTYDGLNRLVDVQRGSAAYQSWVLDALGNMNSITTSSTTENRTHNSQNQLTGVGSSTLTSDNNGNTTTDDYGRTLKYDAWNRLVEYTDGGSLTVTYTYDGLNRRITQTQPAEDPRDFYYSANWQIVEERLGSTTDAQYVWSPVYVDAMVFRDKDTNVGNIRSFAMQDANFSATRVLTLIESTSTWIAERYVNDPYGKFVTYNDAWTLAAGQVAFQHHHQGLMYNDLTGLHWNRNRDYSPSQQRFIQQDPMGYVDGLSLYSPLESSPIMNTDWLGAESVPTFVTIPKTMEFDLQKVKNQASIVPSIFDSLEKAVEAKDGKFTKYTLINLFEEVGIPGNVVHASSGMYAAANFGATFKKGDPKGCCCDFSKVKIAYQAAIAFNPKDNPDYKIFIHTGKNTWVDLGGFDVRTHELMHTDGTDPIVKRAKGRGWKVEKMVGYNGAAKELNTLIQADFERVTGSPRKKPDWWPDDLIEPKSDQHCQEIAKRIVDHYMRLTIGFKNAGYYHPRKDGHGYANDATKL